MLYSRQVLHFFLILNFLLFGCSTNHKKTEIHKNFKNIQEDINKFAQIPHYRAYGNFFFSSKKDTLSLNFTLIKKNYVHYQLILDHPFSNIKAIFNIYPNYTEMIYNQEKRYVGHDLESMTKNFFGYSIPLNDIHNLILGIPKNAFEVKYNHYGNLKSAKYMNLKKIWEIRYIEYFNIPTFLPKKIKLCQQNTFIKIKIYRWIY